MQWNTLLGFRADGRPIYRFAGGAPDDEGGGDGGDDGDDDGAGDGAVVEADLSEGVKKVLARERQATKQVRDEYRPYRAALRAAGIHTVDDLNKVIGGSKGGAPAETVDADKIRREAQVEADQKAFRLVAESKIEARAAKSFADPEDAVAALRADIDDFYGKDGKPDVKAIDRELANLLERKPHFAAKKAGGPDFDGGARQTATTSSTWDQQLREESARKRGRR